MRPRPSAVALCMYGTTTPDETSILCIRRNDMFSPMVAIFCVNSSTPSGLYPENQPPSGHQGLRTQREASKCRREFLKFGITRNKICFCVQFNNSAFGPSTAIATRPSAATRPDFFAAVASLVRNQSIAASISPPVSPSAFLQSIMPAPDFSRSSLPEQQSHSSNNPCVSSSNCRRHTPDNKKDACVHTVPQTQAR